MRIGILQLALDVSHKRIGINDILSLIKSISHEDVINANLSSELCALINSTLETYRSDLTEEDICALETAKNVYALYSCGNLGKTFSKYFDYSQLEYNEGVFTDNYDDLEQPIVMTHTHKHIYDSILRMTETYYYGSNGLKYRKIELPNIVYDNGFEADESLISSRMDNLKLLFEELD